MTHGRISNRREDAIAALDRGFGDLFGSDLRVQAVGVACGTDGFFIRAFRNPQRTLGRWRPLHELGGVRVEYTTSPRPILPAARIAVARGIGSQSRVPEQNFRRPVTGGLELQNYDADNRQGILPNDVNIGTLGFIAKRGSTPVLVSNNHVIAAENQAKSGDRILQSSGLAFEVGKVAASLDTFVPLVPDIAWARHYNNVDAACAEITCGYSAGYLPHHNLHVPSGVAFATLKDNVFMVGRTSEFRQGVIDDENMILEVPYRIGACWFRGSFSVVGVNGSIFADEGDSGAAVVKDNGEIVGLVYAVDGGNAFCCPIDWVMRDLGLTL